MRFKRKMELMYENVVADLSNKYLMKPMKTGEELEKERNEFIDEFNLNLASMISFDTHKKFLKEGDKALFDENCTTEKDLKQFLFNYYKVLNLTFDVIIQERIKNNTGLKLIKGGK